MPGNDQDFDSRVQQAAKQAADAALAGRYPTPAGGTPAPPFAPAGNTQTGAGVQVVVEAQRDTPHPGTAQHQPIPIDPVLYLLSDLRSQITEVRISVQSLAAIQADIKSLNAEVGGLRTSFGTMEKELKGFEARLQKLEATASLGNVPEEVLRQVVGRAVEEGMRSLRRSTSAEAPTKAHPPQGDALVKRRSLDGWISVQGLVKIIGALAALASAAFAGGKLLGG